MMKFEPFLEALGFSGIQKRKMKSAPALIRAFTYVKVDAATLKKVLGKAVQFSPDSGRHVFAIANDKTLMIDVNEHTVVLGNGVKAAHVLRASVNPKSKNHK